jgi:hypothetical protein
MSVYIPPGGRAQVDLGGVPRGERIRLRRATTRTAARRRAREPRPSQVPEHAFDPDPAVPAEHDGRGFCQWCSVAGEPGDARHPHGAPQMRPPVPDEAAEVAARILGEKPDPR